MLGDTSTRSRARAGEVQPLGPLDALLDMCHDLWMSEPAWERLKRLTYDDPMNLEAIPAVRLPELVTRIRRATSAARRSAAQSPQTREFLAAGLRVIEKEFASGANLTNDGDQTAAPFFAWLSRAKVAAEVDVDELPDGWKFSTADDDGAARLSALESRLRNLWEPHRDYIADLLTVALALEHWSAPAYMDEERVGELMTGDLVDSAHEIAYWDLEQILFHHVASFRLQLMATALADRDPELRDSLQRTYNTVDKQWGAVYSEALASHGIEFRPGFTLEMFTNALTAIAEGLALRLMVEPAKPSILDHEGRRSLLGTVALALVAMCSIREGDNRTVDQALRDSLGRQL